MSPPSSTLIWFRKVVLSFLNHSETIDYFEGVAGRISLWLDPVGRLDGEPVNSSDDAWELAYDCYLAVCDYRKGLCDEDGLRERIASLVP